MNRAARIGILCASVAIFGYAGIGHVLGRTPDDKAYRSLTVYGEVLQKVQQDYVDDPNLRTVTAGSLHGMLESLDAQSSYLTPREYDEYKKKLANAGTAETGLTLSKRYGYIIVLSVLPDSPGTKAGIRSGDIFESMSGFTTRDMSVGQAVTLLNGQPGTGIKVGVIRRGKATPEEVDIVREKLATPKIIAQKVDPDILVLRIPSLDGGRADEVRNRLLDAEKPVAAYRCRGIATTGATKRCRSLTGCMKSGASQYTGTAVDRDAPAGRHPPDKRPDTCMSE